jgi:membrane protease YdiL (CAAX protease family)
MIAARAPAAGAMRRMAPVAAAALGVGLLLLRPSLASSLQRPTPALAGVYVAILVGSVSLPLARGRPACHPALAALAGLAAVGLAPAVSGAAPPTNTAVAAVPLSIIAAVSEEALFRRLAFGALDRLGSAVAIAGTAIAFGLVHVPLYGTAALPVDLGAGLLFSWQRWASGSWGAPAVTHVAANVLVVVR